MNVGHYVATLDDDGRAFWGAQRDMQYRTLLGNVDLVAAKHRVDAFPKMRFPGETDEKRQRFFGDPVLGVIEVDSCSVDRHALAALAIIGE